MAEHFAVVRSKDRHGKPTQVNVHRYHYCDSNEERITIAIYIGNHQWIEAELELDDASRLADLIKNRVGQTK